MLPRHIPTLEGKDAERFVTQDKKPLSAQQKLHLNEFKAVYKKHQVK